MRRVLAAAALAALSLLGTGSANAEVCAGDLICGISGCVGTVNVCPTAGSCSGGVSVCPVADPDNCHSSVDVCLGVMLQGSCNHWVCELLPL